MAGAWETAHAKSSSVLVGVPNLEFTTVSWAIALATLRLPEGSTYFAPSHYMVDRCRNVIAEFAVKNNFDYLLFIDADTEPPPDTFYRLRELEHPICSGLYYRRHPPFNACAWQDVRGDELDIKPYTHIEPGTIMDVDLFGMGCCLIDVNKVLRKLDPPWFKWTLDTLPKPEGASEDFYMLRRVRKELGIMPKLHAGVTCQHNGTLAVIPDGKGSSKITGLSG